MAELDPKYVASTRPINRRTAQKQPKQSMPTNLLVQDRIASLKARRRFGAPLAEQLRVLGPATKRKPLSAIIVVGGILSTVSTVGLLLAWIQTSTALAVAGISADEVDLIVVATLTPDHSMPSTAVLVKGAIGSTRAAATAAA